MIDKKLIYRDLIISQGGFYGDNGKWNAIKVINGEVYRDRVETIIVKDGKEVFIKIKDNKDYRLPGGGIDVDTTPEAQAINECHEETHFEIKNIENTGITRIFYYDIGNKLANEIYNKTGILQKGGFAKIFIAEYNGPYNGHIDEVDEDPFIRSGKWYSFKEAMGIFGKEHKEALMQYIKSHENVIESVSEEEELEYIAESYFTNRIKNFFLLRDKKIQEIDLKELNRNLDYLIKEYKIKKKINIFKKSNDQLHLTLIGKISFPVKKYIPNLNITSVEIVHDFTETTMYYNCAFINPITKEPQIHLSREFFEEINREMQIFIFLHELGHVRLSHILYKNKPYPYSIKHGYDGKTANALAQRILDVERGKVAYTEINADRYATLNGAKRYNILKLSNDQDGGIYDYNNQEVARRYDIVTKRNNAFDKRYGITRESYDDTDDYTTESYFTNYFANWFKLNTKEIRTDTSVKRVVEIIKEMKSFYEKNKNKKDSYDGNAKVHSILTYGKVLDTENADNNVILFAIDFSNTNNNTNAYALYSNNKYHVVLNPSFFKLSSDNQIFIILHEIGHIRLNHANPKNMPVNIFGDDTTYNKIRAENIMNDRVMYTELNADLYAVLNGAKLYSILDIGPKSDNFDDRNSTIYTNSELANRYRSTAQRSLEMGVFTNLPIIKKRY